MDVQEAYDQWAEQYDTNQNKTRDLEAISLRESLKGERFENALEIMFTEKSPRRSKNRPLARTAA